MFSLGSVGKGRRKGPLVAGRAGGVWGAGAPGDPSEGPGSWQHRFLSVTWTRHHLRPSWAFSHRRLVIALQVISDFYVHFENEKTKAQRCSELASGSHVARDGRALD